MVFALLKNSSEVATLLGMCAIAATIFEHDTLPVGDDAQTPEPLGCSSSRSA